jgi:uncharacterized protein
MDVVRFRPTSTPTEPTITLQPLPLGLKHRFHAMVKPVGSMCNLDCTYCYYLHKQDLLQQPRQPRMAEEMLERHIRQYIEAQTGDEVVFSWQGGEPTILSLEFFRKVVSLQERHRKRGQRIENDLQTNGTLLDEEWAAFLKQSNFLVGLSCDGPKELHDRYRYTKGGTDTHAKVVEAARLLQKHDVPFAALCVVNRHNAKHPLEVYRFLTRELGAWRVQLISCVEPKVFRNVAPQRWDPTQLPVVGTARAKPGEADSVVTDWSVDPDDWGSFLCAVWDDWYANDFGRVHVDLFETAVAQSMGLPAQRCINAEFCGKGLAVGWATLPKCTSARWLTPSRRRSSVSPSATRCRRTASSVPTSSSAGASVPRTGWCAHLRARPGSTTCAPVSSVSMRISGATCQGS